MLAYIMITDGEVQIIPVSIDLKTFTHVTVKNRRLNRSLLMKHLSYCHINDMHVPVFLIPESEFKNTDQHK